MNKLITIALCIISLALAVSFVSADTPNSYPADKDYSLLIQCINNGTYCSNVAKCNISVSYAQTGELVVSNKLMSNNISTFNFTVKGNQAVKIGKYSANVICQDGATTLNPIAWDYYVTPSGNYNVLGLTIIVFVIIYVVAFFGFFGRNEWLSILGGISLISLGIYTILNGIDIYRNAITDAVSWMTIGLGAIISILAGLSVINDNL